MSVYVTHKRAHFDYEILETFEAGISLLGTEVKSVRGGQGKLEGSYVIIRGNEAFLVGSSIPAYQKKNTGAEYEPERVRKLLLTNKEIRHLEEKSEKQGLTIVPLKLYNKNRKLKLEIGIARGKKKTDKRETIKARETKRETNRLIKVHNTSKGG